MPHFSSQFRTITNFSVRSAVIIVKSDDEPAAQFATELQDWLKQKNVAADINDIHPDQNILVVLGGDGTLLHIAEQAARYSIPVIGINFILVKLLSSLSFHQSEIPSLP